LFYIGFNLSHILSPINNYFFLWYTYLLTLYFIALNGLKIAHHFDGGKYTTRPLRFALHRFALLRFALLRFALHRFALRPHMVESVFEDTRTRSGKVRTLQICKPFCSGLYGKAQPVHNRVRIAI
jgi:hypothetical protein